MKKLILSKTGLSSISLVVLMASASSFAALSTEATSAQTSAVADAGLYVGMAWAITVVTTLGFFGIKQFKKAMGRA